MPVPRPSRTKATLCEQGWKVTLWSSLMTRTAHPVRAGLERYRRSSTMSDTWQLCACRAGSRYTYAKKVQLQATLRCRAGKIFRLLGMRFFRTTLRGTGLEWDGRANRTLVNECIGYATSCLYALSEVAILASGYCSAIGVIHSGDARSMVYDLADTEKFKTVVPLAFKIAKTNPSNPNISVRHACRDLFGQERLVERLFSNLAHIMGE